MKFNWYMAVAILLAIAGVLGSCYIAVNELLPTPAYPEYMWPIIQGVKYIFLTSAWAPVFVVAWNIFLYFAKKQTDPNVQYEASKMLKSWAEYEAYIKLTAAMVMAFTAGTAAEPYAIYISGGIATVIITIRNVLTDLTGAIKARNGT